MTWRLWLPVACYAALIFTLSSIPNLTPPVRVANADKLAHCLEYGCFGLLLYRATRLTWRDRSAVFPIVLTVLIGLTIAVLDELYQGTVHGRTKSVYDAMADVCGVTLAALVGQWIAHIWMEKRREVNARP